MAIDIPTRDTPPRLDSYDRLTADFGLAVPERFNPVVDIIDRWAEEAPDDLALVTLDAEGETVAEHTAADLARESARAARAFENIGISKGHRVFIMLPRIPEWYTAMLGVIRLGAVAMPAPNLLTSRDISYRIRTGHAVAAITDTSGAEKLDACVEPLDSLQNRISVGGRSGDWVCLDDLLEAAMDGEAPTDTTGRDDPILIFFTSGTVSYPKMVLHDASYGLGHVGTARFWHDLRAGDRHWTVSDTGWAKAAWGGLFGQWHERATVIQVALGKPDAEMILSTIGKAQVSSFCAPPTLYRLLVQAELGAYDLSGLRHCTSAGEPLNPEVIRAWKEGTGLDIYDGYGQSETTCVVANFRSVPIRPGSMGRPTPGWTVDIVDDSGSKVPDDVVGNVAIRYAEKRPVGLLREYVGDQAANESSFRNGWYYTGDKAWRDKDGYLWFEGRDDDVITSSAYRIGPFEVESALVEHPAVAEAAVVGKPDSKRTQIVTAFCVLTGGYAASDELAEELKAHCKKLTAPYKYPREIYFATELPKTVSGKIRRSQLRQDLSDHAIDKYLMKAD